MKYVKLMTVICLVGLFLSCSNDDDNNQDNDSSAAVVAATVQEGTWRITYFFDSEVDETDSFMGYNFTFRSNGTVDAANDLLSQSGTWDVTDGNGTSLDDDDFILAFPTGSIGNFEDLSEDWDVVSSSATTVVLTHVSGGNGGTDFLTFTKN